ncbi:MAG: lipoprotein [Patescibacteria group bacterium]
MKKIFLLATAAFILAGCSLTAGPKAADGGIWKSTDTGKTWTHSVAVPVIGGKTASIANTDVRRITFDPQDHNTIYLSTEKNGIVYSYDGGNTWRSFKELNTGKVRAVAVDTKNKCTLYALMDNKLFKSMDCGRFWKNAYYHQNTETVLTDIKVDWYNNSILYLVTSAGEILKSASAGETWFSVKDV